MKKYSRIFTYLKSYKTSIVWYFISILLSIIFSIISIGMLVPFMNIIFGVKHSIIPEVSKKPDFAVVHWLKEQLNLLINTNDSFHALGTVCILIILSIALKNLFLYLSYRAMGPIKNGIVNRFRIDMYDKILKLPIGYFTEQRKGDLMSRMTNDVSEVESSVVGTLEGWVRDPLTIIINLFVLFSISPMLTGFILLCIPIMGFVIGRLSRSLKKQSSEVAVKGGETISIIDETLGGLRVIKAFNVEAVLRNKFLNTNTQLLNARNRIGFRRDLASPLSEMMGVAIFSGILWFGGRLVLTGELGLDGALFLAYMGMFYNVIDPAKSISTAFSNMLKGAAAIDRIEEVLNAPVTVDENPNGKKLLEFKEGIEFNNVGFSYDDVVILNNINLKVAIGKTVALVGKFL